MGQRKEGQYDGRKRSKYLASNELHRYRFGTKYLAVKKKKPIDSWTAKRLETGTDSEMGLGCKRVVETADGTASGFWALQGGLMGVDAIDGSGCD